MLDHGLTISLPCQWSGHRWTLPQCCNTTRLKMLDRIVCRTVLAARLYLTALGTSV